MPEFRLRFSKIRRRGKRRDVKDRDTTGFSGAPTDAASVRTQKVTMASEHLTSDQDRRAEDSQEHVDIFV